jgi:nucleoid-associated protein YgaU
MYVVKEGDCLNKIAGKVYGDRSKWTVIYNNNRSIIKNPDLIYPGQELAI